MTAWRIGKWLAYFSILVGGITLAAFLPKSAGWLCGWLTCILNATVQNIFNRDRPSAQVKK